MWNTIKALLHDDIDDEKSAFIALEENLQREDLSPVEEGAAYVRLMERFSATSTKALAQRIGKPENRIQQMIRLHRAPEFLRDAVMKGSLVPLKDLAPGSYVLTVSARSRLGNAPATERQIRFTVTP